MEAVQTNWVEGMVQSLSNIECAVYQNTHARLSMATTDSNLDDQQSFNLIRQGGKMRDQGVAGLYRKYAGQFRNKFLRQRVSASDAEDIVQEVFIKIVEKRDTYRGDAPLAAWLWRIAHHCMIDHFRSVKKGSPEDTKVAKEAAIKAAAAVVSERTRAMEAGKSRMQGGVQVTEFPYAADYIEKHDHMVKFPTHMSPTDEEGWDALERHSETLWKYDPPPGNVSYEDCVIRGITEFASTSKKNSERALAIRLVADGKDQVSIAHAIDHDPGGIRQYLLQCRKIIKEFLLPCQEFK
jgi:RNA polymerase sigma factor (sigma-70 family)